MLVFWLCIHWKNKNNDGGIMVFWLLLLLCYWDQLFIVSMVLVTPGKPNTFSIDPWWFSLSHTSFTIHFSWCSHKSSQKHSNLRRNSASVASGSHAKSTDYWHLVSSLAQQLFALSKATKISWGRPWLAFFFDQKTSAAGPGGGETRGKRCNS
jgi:hypothetical protein